MKGDKEMREMDELYKKIDDIAYFMGIGLSNDLRDEIHFRCNFEPEPIENIEDNIKACLRYVIDNGQDALINEEDDGNIWEYV